MASQYYTALTSCAASHTCGNLANTLTLGTPLLFLLVTLTVLVPCLLGVFWGGPLVARELETGTSQFAWMQSISRSHWLTVKVGWALLAAATWGGAVSALVTWWSSPVNALKHQNFQPGQFDIQGIVPVGYALFAVALGIAAGTIGVFTFLRLVIGQDLRSHYLTPLTKTITFLHPPALHALPKGSYWLVSGGLVGPGGQLPSSQAYGGPSIAFGGVPVSLSNTPSACRALIFQSPPSSVPAWLLTDTAGSSATSPPASTGHSRASRPASSCSSPPPSSPSQRSRSPAATPSTQHIAPESSRPNNALPPAPKANAAAACCWWRRC